MDISLATPLLGGLTPQAFMRRHWQKKPLLIRAAVLTSVLPIERARLFELASRDGVESRLVIRETVASRPATRETVESRIAMHDDERWTMRQGPFRRGSLPPLKQPGWSLLVQGVDLHLPAARDLLSHFRFVPDARLDDVMVSFASDRGGVGPHVDSYDVFLLQLQGQRRWRIGPVRDPALVADAPLKILARFEPEEEWLLDPGDMLYLPPGWAHDGVAEGECLTASIGFRAAAREDFGREVLQRALDAIDPDEAGPLYRDPKQPATTEPARIPETLLAFGAAAVARVLDDADALACAVGEVLSEPKPGVWFDPPGDAVASAVLRLDARSRMLYDDRFVFINGESFRAAGRDARLMRQLADERRLAAQDLHALSRDARVLVDEWIGAGWLVGDG